MELLRIERLRSADQREQEHRGGEDHRLHY